MPQLSLSVIQLQMAHQAFDDLAHGWFNEAANELFYIEWLAANAPTEHPIHFVEDPLQNVRRCCWYMRRAGDARDRIARAYSKESARWQEKYGVTPRPLGEIWEALPREIEETIGQADYAIPAELLALLAAWRAERTAA